MRNFPSVNSRPMELCLAICQDFVFAIAGAELVRRAAAFTGLAMTLPAAVTTCTSTPLIGILSPA